MIFGISSSSFQYEEDNQNSNLYDSRYKKKCLHKKNWKKDFDMLKQLGIQSYRFSIEWSQIQTKKGVINKKEMKRYEKYVDYMILNKIEPVICLFHFSQPKWFYESGSFLKNPKDFLSFAEYVIRYFKGKVKYYVVYNEPNVFVTCSYIIKRWPPKEFNFFHYRQVISNMKNVYNTIVDHYGDHCRFGVTVNIIPHYRNDFLNEVFDELWNKCFLKGLSKKTFFIGINYYFAKDTKWRDLFNMFSKDNQKIFQKKQTQSDIGWPVDSDKLKSSVKYIERYGPKNVEIWITENGLSSPKGEKQCAFIINHVQSALSIPKIKRYYYWTLLDCFEWDYGKKAHFGLVKVDPNTGNRSKKKSFDCYKKIIQQYKIKNDSES
jgi:beta-glucosidase